MSSAHCAYNQLEEVQDCEQVLVEQLPQVRYIAKRIHDRLPPHVPLEDLVHAGVIGLIDAVRKFDVRKNVQFQSYAKFRIRGAILDSLREMDWSPRDLRRKRRQLEEAEQRLRSEFGRSASEEEIAAAAGMSLDRMREVLLQLRGLELHSLEPEEGDEGETRAQFVPTSTEESPFQQCLRGELKEMLARAIGELPERERQVLSLYYYEELTMREVGAVMGVGESRVSQIHSMALLRLKARLQELMAENKENEEVAVAEPAT